MYSSSYEKDNRRPTMADLSKMMRPKRFGLVHPGKVRLKIETMTGAKLDLALENCSLNGLGASYQGGLPENEAFETGSLIPSSKVVCEDSEFTLGRLVLRRIIPNDSKVFLAFSTVDMRVPIDGQLSRYIDSDLESRKSPYEYEMSPEKFSVRNFMEGVQTNVDLFSRAKQFQIFYEEWVKSTKFQFHNIRTKSKGGRVNLKQKRKGNRNDYIVMGSNDYLGLAADPEVLEAAKKAIDDYGFGSTGSPVATGLTDLHMELSDELAKLLRRDKVLLFNSGYTANVGIITGLTTNQDLIVADMLSHASILDGMQMSQATSRFFKHNNPTHLDKILGENRAEHTGTLVITEGAFSMNGDVPPLDEIFSIAAKHNARVMVDEAHSFGVIGPTGLGCWEMYDESKVDIIMGTFSKICGGIGGFIATDEEVANWLFFNSRPHLFSVSIPPTVAAAALAALRVFRAKPELVTNLKNNIKHFVKGLRDLGFHIDPDHQSAVIPVVIGDEDKIFKMNQILWENGVYVLPIVYPVVGRKDCRFRFTMMSTHTVSDLDFVLNVIEKAMLKANFTVKEEVSNLSNKELAA